MKNSNSRETRTTVTTKINEQRGQGHIPSVGGKLFRRTSENIVDIH